ncbi:PilW family protein [Vibrio breoganii]|uniref:PilW family protein n=1 Tax=Vibrio breoganii TaxID=553239 RepID=UPI000C8196D7|nr:prepilin-type N-terminal cleavage/methylation domain-containing protein [Vibrio breoganii]PML11773.1 prepilin-type N-terminal cleavage/methylation domain-containing protein [Vibrio breoganii]
MKQRGFTLIEMIVTIVVVAIIFLGIAGFVEFGTKGYTTSIDRQRIQNQARFAIEKMSREIQHAVPNSFNIHTDDSKKCLSFYPIQHAGFYKIREMENEIDFVVITDGFIFDDISNEKLVVNPSRIEDLDIDTSAQSVALSSAVSSDDGSYYSISWSPASNSVANRHFVYNDMVTYCITPSNQLQRNEVQFASEVVYGESSFSYQQTSLQRGGLVHLNLLFQSGDEKSQYKHDVQVSNVP